MFFIDPKYEVGQDVLIRSNNWLGKPKYKVYKIQKAMHRNGWWMYGIKTKMKSNIGIDGLYWLYECEVILNIELDSLVDM